MVVLISILSILAFIKTVSYGLYEYKNNNKSGGIIIFILALIVLILPSIMTYIR